jgi:hypothetical protein
MAIPGVRNLVLVRDPASDERIRRYRLARLDDIALASPPLRPTQRRRLSEAKRTGAGPAARSSSEVS